MDWLSDFASRIQEKLDKYTREFFVVTTHFLNRITKRLGSSFTFTKEKTRISVIGLVVVLVTSSIIFAPHSSATVSDFYPGTCSGGWLNPQNATGLPSLDGVQPANSYTEKNSAVLNNSHSDIVCNNFAGNIPSGTNPKTFTVKFHWSIDDGSVAHDGVSTPTPATTTDVISAPATTSQSPSDTTTATQTPTDTKTTTDTTIPASTITTPTPTPTSDTTTTPPATPVITPDATPVVPATPVLTAPTTSSDTQPAADTTIPTTTPAATTATTDQPKTVASAFKKTLATLDALVTDALSAGDTTMFHSPSDMFVVRYSVDGTNWNDIGTVNAANWQTATFTISGPDIAGWSDLSKLHVGLFSLSPDGTQPVVYIDAVEVDVDYADASTSVIVPTVKVVDPSISIVAPQKDNFTLDEAPVFSITNPNLSTAQILHLVQNDKAVVVDDHLGVFSETAPKTIPTQPPTSQTDTGPTSSTLTAPAQSPSDTTTATQTPTDTKATADTKVPTDTKTTTDTTIPASTITTPEPTPTPTPTSDTTTTPPATPVITPDATPVVPATPVLTAPSETTSAQTVTPAPVSAPVQPVSDLNSAISTSTADSSNLGAFAVGALGSDITGVQAFQKVDFKHLFANTVLRYYSMMRQVFRMSFANALLALAGDTASSPIDAVVLDASGNQTTIAVTVQHVVVNGVGQDQVVVSKPDNMFRPGKYTLQVTLHTPDVNIISEQDFSWGVLAINVDRSVYHAGDTAYVQMGVIDDFGHTICDADMTLVITSPFGVDQTYTTSDGTVVREPQCGPDNYIHVPDYYAHPHIGSEEGVYHMTLTANTRNGIRTVHDAFTVSSDIPFDVVRSGPTRVYPADKYPAEMQITSPVDWQGTIVDTLPSSFEVSALDGVALYDTVTTTGDTTTVTWNVSLVAGKTTTIGYSFLPPPISPEFYLLGPLTFYNKGDDSTTAIPVFKEMRRWQIADDSSCTYIGPAIGFWNNASNWSCLRVPTTGPNSDTVTIPTGNTVTLDTNTPATGGALTLLTIAGTLKTGSAGVDYNINTTALTISSGGVLNATSAASGSTIIINGSGTGAGRPFQNAGTFTPGTSTFQYVTSGTDIEATTYYNLTINGGSGNDTLNGDTIVTNNLLVGNASSGVAFSTSATSNYRLTAGHITLGPVSAGSMTFAANASTITLTGDTSLPLFTNSVAGGSTAFIAGTSTISVTSDYSGVTIFGGLATNFYNITLQPNFSAATCASGTCNYSVGVLPTVAAAGLFDVKPNGSGHTLTVDVNTIATNSTFGASATVKIEGTAGASGVLTGSGCVYTASTLPTFYGVITTLNGASGLGTSFLVNSSAGIVPGEPIQIDSEEMLVNTVVGSTLNVTRGLNGTSIVSHATSAIVIEPYQPMGTPCYTKTIDVESGGTFSGSSTFFEVSNILVGNGGQFNAGSSSFIYTDGLISSNQILISSGGTFNAGSSIINIGGDNTLQSTGTTNTFITNNGTFTAGTSTVYFNMVNNGSAVNQIYNAGLWTGSNKFYNLALNTYVPGTNNYQLGADTEVANIVSYGRWGARLDTNNFNLTVGYVDFCHSLGLGAFIVTNASGTKSVTLNGASGTLFNNVNSGTGAFAKTCTGASAMTTTTANFAVTSNASVTIFGVSAISFTNLTFAPPALLADATYTMGIVPTLSGSLTSNPLSPSGTPTLLLSGALTIPAAKTFTVSGDSHTSTKLLSNYSVGLVSIASTGILLANTTTLTITGTSGTLFANSGTFTPGTSTVTFGGASVSATLDSGNFAISGTSTNNFYNLTITGTGTFTLGAPTEVTGTSGISLPANVTLDASSSACSGLSCNITAATIFITSNAGSIFNARNATIKLTGTGTPATLFTRGSAGVFTAGTSTVQVMTPSGVARFLSGAGTVFYNVTIGDAGVSATVVNAGDNFTIASGGTFYLKNGSFDLDGSTVAVITASSSTTMRMDSGTLFCIGGTTGASALADCTGGVASTGALASAPAFTTFTFASGSTIKYLNAAAQTVFTAFPYVNLTVAPIVAAATTYAMTAASMTVNGNLTVNPTGSAFAFVWNMSGSIAITPQDGTTSAVNEMLIKKSGSVTSVTVNTNNNTITTGTMDIESGATLSAGSSNITVPGNWICNGTFTSGTSSVLLSNTITTLPSSTLTTVGGINSAVLSFSVASGTGIVAGETIQIDNEMMQVTAVSGTTVTVAARGANGTAAISHSAGATVLVIVGVVSGTTSFANLII
ncbi:MAG: hypothetical protein WCG55_00280 [bacterium]